MLEPNNSRMAERPKALGCYLSECVSVPWVRIPLLLPLIGRVLGTGETPNLAMLGSIPRRSATSRGAWCKRRLQPCGREFDSPLRVHFYQCPLFMDIVNLCPNAPADGTEPSLRTTALWVRVLLGVPYLLNFDSEGPPLKRRERGASPCGGTNFTLMRWKLIGVLSRDWEFESL